MKNHNSTWADPNDYSPAQYENRPANRSANVANASRSMLALAVSRTSDPRDGWNLYWTYGIPGQDGCLNNICTYVDPGTPGKVRKAGAEHDYLSMGITSKHLVLEYQAGWLDVINYNPATDKEPPSTFTRTITVVRIDPLPTDKQKLAPVYQTDSLDPLRTPDGKPVGAACCVQPAVQHAPDVSGDLVFFASKWIDKTLPESHSARYNVLLWALDTSSGTPQFYRQPVPVRRFLKVDAVIPQKAHPDLGAAAKPTLTGDGLSWVNKLVYRNANLYLTFAECGDWKTAADPHCQLSALRFVRIELDGILKKQGKLDNLLVDVAVDRTFGGRNVKDPAGKLAWYSFPAVEANKAGDAALVYHRSADWLYPEARYSAYFLKEQDIRPSRALKEGNYTLGTGGAAKWHHYVGMSVDGFDDTGIWMIQGYAAKVKNKKRGAWEYAIGKVLGKPYVDLVPVPVSLRRKGAGGGPTDYVLWVRVENAGDRRALATRASLALSRDKKAGADIALRSIRLPALLAGRKRTHALEVTVPRAARARGYRFIRLTLDAASAVREYSEGNNTVYVPIP